jgi:simple sugar transport system permease protein
MTEIFIGILTSAILAGGVLVLAALGETLSERVGVMNLGLEGLISMGAVIAVLTSFATDNAWLSFMAAGLVGLALGILFAFTTVVIRANQILCGLSLTFIGLGLSASIGNSVAGRPVTAEFELILIPYLSEIPVLGSILFSHSLPVYLAYFFLPLVIYFLFFHTRHGLNIRSVGENPASAESAGVSVMTIRMIYVSLGGLLTALAGAYLTLIFIPTWSEGITGGRGWIAIAVVIFARCNPVKVVFGSILFGFVTALGFAAQAMNWPISPTFLSSLPYLLTLLVLLIPTFNANEKFLKNMPAAIGRPYYREERN